MNRIWRSPGDLQFQILQSRRETCAARLLDASKAGTRLSGAASVPPLGGLGGCRPAHHFALAHSPATWPAELVP